ncbi:BglG family transcription antiterminator [Candidatus Stoquefichus massiliensis]|uniref:BglG family transcription antiterminator n=1 Tax=Candidatus Stoquefichus massiliensis TaxID=1470350 RepID=UPI0004819439|nr:PTS sugar transporter subunit IIA [Candidatus Stoquefichus massiliensis]
MLNRKYEKLIKILLEKDIAISAAQLSSEMNVSIRSIKTYVHDINDLYPDCIHSDASGYIIQHLIATQALAEETTIPQTSHERVIYIINKLLQAATDTYELCDLLYVSLSTLKNDLKKVKTMIKKYDLLLQNKNDVLSIEGLEINKRKLVSSILYKESNINFVDLTAIQNNFKDIDIFYIKEVITQVFKKHLYFINDYSLTNLILHIAIAIDRIQNNNSATYQYHVNHLAQHEYELAKEISIQLQEYFHIIYNDNEVCELAILLMSRATSLNYHNINKKNLYQYIDKDVIQLVYKLIDSIQSFYFIELEDPEFFIRFALHIKNLLIRSQNAHFSKNPLVQEIKAGCPLIYDISVYVSSIIKEETGVQVNDDEIAYIAFHIGSTIETQKELQNKVTAVLYCPQYYDMSTNLVYQIQNHFSHQLLIKDVVNQLEDMNHESVDFIISTIPIHTLPLQKSVQIHIFFQQQDILEIEKKINEIKLFKEKQVFQNNLEKLLSKELFEVNIPYDNQNDIIDYMSFQLYRKGYVHKNFQQQIWEREEMSSTAYGNFAIPHAMKMEAKKTAISILICKKGIRWGDETVQIVLMMCFHANERYLFNQVFEPITKILSEPMNITLLSQCQNYLDFIQTMVSLYQI